MTSSHALGTGDRQFRLAGRTLAFRIDTEKECGSQRSESLAEAELLEQFRGVVEAEFLEGGIHTHLADLAQ